MKEKNPININYKNNSIERVMKLVLRNCHAQKVLCIFGTSFIYAEGLFVSPVNIATKLTGVQIGLINETTNLRGVQIGLLNLAGQDFYPETEAEKKIKIRPSIGFQIGLINTDMSDNVKWYFRHLPFFAIRRKNIK